MTIIYKAYATFETRYGNGVPISVAEKIKTLFWMPELFPVEMLDVEVKEGQEPPAERMVNLRSPYPVEHTMIYGPLMHSVPEFFEYFTIVSSINMPMPTDFQGISREPMTTVNQKVNVAVAGMNTMDIQSLFVAYNCCTQELQGHLDNGWRILAVCVQPDQRRPDYVMGKREARKNGETVYNS